MQNQKSKNYGFVKPSIEEDHYVLGSLSLLPKDVLQPDGDWSAYLPAYEPQYNNNYDSCGCTIWGTENAIEILLKRIYGGEPNFSERYIYILSNTRPPGNDPHVIAETIRSFGLIDDHFLPITKNYDEFLKPNPMSRALLNAGRAWTSTIDFKHEWLWKNAPDKLSRIRLLKEALKYSPIGVSVTAWFKDENGLYIDNGQPNCHWCVCYGLEEKDGEYYPLIFDSYDQSLKKLHPDHHIEVAKRYSFKKKDKSWWKELLEGLFNHYD